MFGSHGQFQLSVQGNTIQASANGPFNSEAIHNYRVDILEAVNTIDGVWGQLTVLHKNCLFTPNASEEMRALTKLRKDIGLIAVAFIFDDCFGEMILKEQLQDIYNSMGIPCEFFSTSTHANNWLQEKLLIH